MSLQFIQSILLVASLTLFLQPTGYAAAATAAQGSVPTKSFDDYLVQASVLFKQGQLDEAPAALALILHVAGPKADVREAILEAIDLWPANRNENLERIVKLLDPETRYDHTFWTTRLLPPARAMREPPLFICGPLPPVQPFDL